MKRTLSTLAAFAALGAVPAAAFVLTDGNSSANVDPTSVPTVDQRGMNSWIVDGTNHLYQQWFWYRVGATGPEATIDTISAPVVQLTGSNVGKITYTGGLIRVETTYILTGGAAGSNRSDMLESIRVTNTSAGSLDYHFFQFTDFDLNNTFANDSLTHSNANTFDQVDALFGAQETISTPVANHWQGSISYQVYNSLTDATATTLTDSGSPLGPGDCQFGWQWDFTLGAGASFVISKDKNITPEPATFVTLGLGLAGLLAARRRRS